MFGKKKEINVQDIISLLCDFILDTSITDRERRIAIMAKADLEANKYPIAILNKVIVSFQMEAMKSGLSTSASKLYDKIYPVLIASKPFGTNLGYIGMHSTYLD